MRRGFDCTGKEWMEPRRNFNDAGKELIEMCRGFSGAGRSRGACARYIGACKEKKVLHRAIPARARSKQKANRPASWI